MARSILLAVAFAAVAATAAGSERHATRVAALLQAQAVQRIRGTASAKQDEKAAPAPAAKSIPGTGGVAVYDKSAVPKDSKGVPQINKQPGDPKEAQVGWGYQSPEHQPDNFLEPLPGTSDKGIEVKPRQDVGGALAHTLEYANQHAFDEDLRSLVQDYDRQEVMMNNLGAHVIQKENYVAGLQKRINFLVRDMDEERGTLAATVEHINAIEARLARLAAQRQQAAVLAQKNQFEIASQKLRQEVSNVQQVSNALNTRINRLGAGIASSRGDEIELMRLSLQPSVAAHFEEDPDAASAVAQASE